MRAHSLLWLLPAVALAGCGSTTQVGYQAPPESASTSGATGSTGTTASPASAAGSGGATTGVAVSSSGGTGSSAGSTGTTTGASGAIAFTVLPTFGPLADGGALDIAVADVDGDGNLDFAATRVDNTVDLFTGRGDGTFDGRVVAGMQGHPWALALGDFDGNTSPDLFVTQGYPVNDVDLIADVFFPHVSTSSPPIGELRHARLADLNGDGRADLIGVSEQPAVTVILGRSDDSLAGPSQFGTNTSSPHAFALGDFDRDGRTDLAYATRSGDQVQLYLGNGQGAFSPGWSGSVGSTNSVVDVVAGDWNNDGKLDLAVAREDALQVLLGRGDGTFAPPAGLPVQQQGQWAPMLDRLVAGDFNGDGRLDLAASDQVTNVYVFQGHGDGTFSQTLAYPYWTRALAAADFNHDGKADLLVSPSVPTDGFVLLLGR